MESVASELNRLLMESFYGPRAEQSLLAIFKGYTTSQELVEGMFMHPEAHDLLPHIRRGFIEQGIRTQMTTLPNVVATAERVKGGTHYYTKVRFDDRLTVTISHADSIGSMPREALFRKGFSELQYQLFSRNRRDSGERYAIITHGPSFSRAVGTLPLAFCRIGFPDARYRGFVHQVDLLRAYKSLFTKLIAHETIKIGEATAELLATIASEEQGAS